MSLLGPPNPAAFAAVLEGPNSGRLRAVDVPHQVQNTSSRTDHPLRHTNHPRHQFPGPFTFPVFTHPRNRTCAGPNSGPAMGLTIISSGAVFLSLYSIDSVMITSSTKQPAVVPLALSLLLPPCLHPPLLRNASCSTTKRGFGSSSHRNPHPRRFWSSASARQIRPVLTHRFLLSATPHHPPARMAQLPTLPRESSLTNAAVTT